MDKEVSRVHKREENGWEMVGLGRLRCLCRDVFVSLKCWVTGNGGIML